MLDFDKKQVFGFDFVSAASVNEIAQACVNYHFPQQETTMLPIMITPNAAQVVMYNNEFQHLKPILKNAFLILPDGQPIVWTSRFIGQRLQARLTGSDLFPALWQQIKTHHKTAYCIVSDDLTAQCLQQDYASAKTYVPPYFKLDDNKTFDELVAAITSDLLDFQPDFVFLGIGYPKQEILALELSKQLQGQIATMPLFFALGASYEFYCGLRQRAPLFYQHYGLEWLYRFMQEPKRMWKRYTVDNLRFIGLMFKEILASRR